MKTETIDALFTEENLLQMFPQERTKMFFEALFGDDDEGAFDISLGYLGCNEKTISMELLLRERPGHCLACNLTQGLPTVFSRHPVINIAGIVEEVEKKLAGTAQCQDWSLGYTQQKSSDIHTIPLTITLAP